MVATKDQLLVSDTNAPLEVTTTYVISVNRDSNLSHIQSLRLEMKRWLKYKLCVNMTISQPQLFQWNQLFLKNKSQRHHKRQMFTCSLQRKKQSNQKLSQCENTPYFLKQSVSNSQKLITFVWKLVKNTLWHGCSRTVVKVNGQRQLDSKEFKVMKTWFQGNGSHKKKPMVQEKNWMLQSISRLLKKQDNTLLSTDFSMETTLNSEKRFGLMLLSRNQR